MSQNLFSNVQEPDVSAVIAVRNSLQNKAAAFYSALQQLQDRGDPIPQELKLAEDVIFCCLTEYDPAMVAYMKELQHNSQQLQYQIDSAHAAMQTYLSQLGIMNSAVEDSSTEDRNQLL